MCFYSKQSKTAQELEHRFKAKFIDKKSYQPKHEINGFEHPKTAVILSNSPQEIQLVEWGLIPTWAKDSSFQKNTLNAKVETIKEKPSFKDYIVNRCLILADGFYEWQWLDSKGKQKQKYLISSNENEIFAFAGIWCPWSNPATGEKKITYSMLTTKANDLMSEIHNHKKRMPVILSRENEEKWLKRMKIDSNIVELKAEKVDEIASLF
jgi:putative SOS response-associated peptidase YedK